MAQNERQGIEAAGRGGTTGGGTTGTPQTGAERSAPPQGTEQGRREVEPERRVSGGEGQPGGRLSRREGWEEQFGSFFGASPFALFRRLSDDMDRLFFGGGQGLGPFGAFSGRFLPHIDINEREDKVVITADLPGCRPEDFQVEIENDALVLQGERRSEHEESRAGMRRSERSYGTFRRVIPLPPGANAEAAAARFENGVLEIEIPVQQQSGRRRLEVRSGGTTAASPRTEATETTRH